MQGRLVLEASQHPAAFFVTLTYSQEHLPTGSNLSKRHVQLYLKRLREDVEPRRVRYFCSGEYGERLGRPHYHLALFGALVPREIREAWGLGIVDIRELGPESAGYICGYILKSGIVSRTKAGEREPEFRLMSRRPGIGGEAGDVLADQFLRALPGEDMPAAFRMGGKLWPLGRYLRDRMRDGRVDVDSLRRARGRDRALMMMAWTEKDRSELVKLRELSKHKAHRAAIRAAAVIRQNNLRKKL